MQSVGSRRLRYWVTASSLGLFLLLVTGWVFRGALLTAAGAALVEDDGVRKMQAAVVLGGDGECDRIMRAAYLARAGYAPFVIVSGPEAFGVHECDLTINYAEGRGYSPLLFRPYPNNFKSTRQEVDGLGKYLRVRGITGVLLVTSNYHTRRSARLFRRENPGIEVRVVPAPDRFFTPQTWWRTREGRKTFLLEWSKTVAARLGS